MIAVASDNSCVDQQVSPLGAGLDLEQLLLENRTLNCEKNRYKSLHERAKAREELLKQEVQQLNARIRYLEQKLYGRKSEKNASSEKNTSASSSSDEPSKRKRGHQEGSPGHGRRDYSHLPVKEKSYELDEAICPKCGCPLHEDPRLGTDDSETIEIEVKAYRRKAKKKKYKKGCQCEGVPGIITAPGPAKLISKGKLGISMWVHILLEKYLYQRPINRLLELFKDIEYDASPGTIGGGLKILAPLFEPVLKEIIKKNQTERHLHADETRWLVFESIGNIFHLNNLRVKHEIDSPEFAQADHSLREALEAMKQQFELELTEADLHPERAKRLNSLKEHWEGLQVFVDHPWIPMDNSEAERKMYIAALGRKNYYGSGSVWSGHFTASLFSIFQTLKLWNINPRKWLTQYLQACAENRGQAPLDLSCFVPWTMSKEQLARLHYPEPS